MKKQLTMALLLVFTALANTMQAQEVDAFLQRQIDSLIVVTKNQDKMIRDKDKKLAPIRKVKDQCDKAIKGIEHTMDKIDEKVNYIINLEDSLAVMRRPYDSLMAINETLENYKDQVEPLVSRQLSQMATTVDNTWLGKTYAETDMDNLLEELKLYKAFKDTDQGVGKAYVKLNSFCEDVVLYKQGVEIVNNPYDSDRIAAIIQPFENMAKKEKHPGRMVESEEVLGQLKGYSECLQRFQKGIIEVIDEMLEGYKRDGTSKKAWKQVRSFLESAEGEAAVAKLSQIPWLEKQYGMYVRQLEADPYSPNHAKAVIMGLQP